MHHFDLQSSHGDIVQFSSVTARSRVQNAVGTSAPLTATQMHHFGVPPQRVTPSGSEGTSPSSKPHVLQPASIAGVRTGLDFGAPISAASFGTGLVNGVKDSLVGIIDIVKHPVQTVDGMVQAVQHPVQTMNSVQQRATQAYDKFKKENGNQKAQDLGNLVGHVLVGAVGTKGVTLVAKGAKTAGDLAKIGELGGRTSPITSVIKGKLDGIKAVGDNALSNFKNQLGGLQSSLGPNYAFAGQGSGFRSSVTGTSLTGAERAKNSFNFSKIDNKGTGPASSVKTNLDDAESAGGHTIAKHVGKTDQQLLDRLQNDTRIGGASSFTDKSVAQKVVDSTIDSNRNKLENFMNTSKPGQTLVLSYDGDGSVVGRTVQRGSNQVQDATRATVVVKKTTQNGFLLTAYPKK
ncbi:MAG: hypothetical protein A2201_08750 [Alicyclobacillus sp. RIFOXYA1_FULL_53_8]|nr:MAG: hypothetical protein A2201_08750 [Alicyclobacillus sp. RIFOXYA1_FULL_53_8]